MIGGGWQQVSNKDGEYTRWLVADIEYICPGTSRISTITGTIVNLHLRVGSTGAGDIAFEVGTGCTHRSGGQGIDGGGEGGDIEGKEDGILGSWVVGTKLVVEAVQVGYISIVVVIVHCKRDQECAGNLRSAADYPGVSILGESFRQAIGYPAGYIGTVGCRKGVTERTVEGTRGGERGGDDPRTGDGPVAHQTSASSFGCHTPP